MDDGGIVTRLAAEIADAGALVARLERYRAGTSASALALRAAAFAVGDRARRGHHQSTLDADTAIPLLAEAQAVVRDLRAALDAIRSAPDYAAAVAAHAAGDMATLAVLLPTIFAGLELVDHPCDLYQPVVWRQRNRPLAADVVADAITALAADGIPAPIDDLAPGADPDLPAVALADTPPDGEAVVLRLTAADLPAPLCRVTDTGEILVHSAPLRVPFCVLLRTTLTDDEVERTPVDWQPWRRALRAALRARGLTVGDV